MHIGIHYGLFRIHNHEGLLKTLRVNVQESVPHRLIVFCYARSSAESA